MVFFILCAAVVLTSLLAWVVLHVGLEAAQSILALVMMTIVWHLLHRRANMSIADDFRNW